MTTVKIIEPQFGSNITDLIIELDYLRRRKLSGTTHPLVFFELKKIFHILESIGSARIEGNNTTIAEVIESRLERNDTVGENIQEIINIENSLSFIDNNSDHIEINKLFVSELHKTIVKDLTPPPGGEGDKTPGKYREIEVTINKSQHKPPQAYQVNEFMEEMYDFINNQYTASKYDLLKSAIAHHRFTWIHPFTNGNGRTVRLLTYAMLVKQGFNLDVAGRIINPTAIFCSDRDLYYQNLAKADKGTDTGILEWCEYVLIGLKNEISKIDNLLDYKFLKEKILIPAIEFALDRKTINATEFKILKVVIEKQEIQASDVKHLFPGKISAQISRDIRGLRDKKMLIPISDNARKYTLGLSSSFLFRGIIVALDNNGFLPIRD